MKYFLLFLCSICFVFAYSQKTYNSKINVTPNDTVDPRKQVKTAFIKNNFVVTDLDSDTISTYPKEVKGISGYTFAIAIIKSNKVTFSGFYGVKKVNFLGVTIDSNEHKKIIKYNGSKTWPLLENIARTINGEISYSN